VEPYRERIEDFMRRYGYEGIACFGCWRYRR
jgi:hypothetical protein